jgi:hypothetical protein
MARRQRPGLWMYPKGCGSCELRPEKGYRPIYWGARP